MQQSNKTDIRENCETNKPTNAKKQRRKQTNLISKRVVIDKHMKDLGVVNVQQHPSHLASQVGIYGLEKKILFFFEK